MLRDYCRSKAYHWESPVVRRHRCQMNRREERGVDHVETMDGPEILKSVDRIDKLDKIGRRTFGLDDAETQERNTLVNVNILNM